MIGVAYKADVNDTRESPALRDHRAAARRRAPRSSYHDPHVPELPSAGPARACPLDAEALARRTTWPWWSRRTRRLDWEMVGREAPLVVDLRNVVPEHDGKVWTL